MHELSGFPYAFPDLRGSLMESVLVVTDESDIPVAGVAAERITQLYLWMDDEMHPAAKLRIVRQLHESLAEVLRSRGYGETNCFLPPQVERSFGRRLMRNFGWVKNWASFARAF